MGTAARADDLVWTTGRVLDAGGQPLASALVAVYDDSNRVVDYVRTDSNGEYALAVPKHVLHLDRHSVDVFTQVFNNLTRFVGDAAGFVANPVRAGVHAVTSSQAANFADPLTRGGIMAGGAVADQMLSLMTPRTHRPLLANERKVPGALLIKVINPRSNDLVGVNHVYWIQREVFKAGGKQTTTLAAWLDPVRLSPVDSETPSKIENDYLRFTAARLEPSIAEPGQRVRISTRLPLPPDPPIYVVVVARNNRTGQKWELTPAGNGRFEGEFQVDRHFPPDDQFISIVSYAARTETPGRRPDLERSIEGAGLWDPAKPCLFNPLLLVSRSRADLVLTIVQPDNRPH
jgi:hypothetical protein